MDRLGGTTLDCAGHVAAEFAVANGEPAWIGGRCDRHGENRDATADGGVVQRDWRAGVCGRRLGGSRR